MSVLLECLRSGVFSREKKDCVLSLIYGCEIKHSSCEKPIFGMAANWKTFHWQIQIFKFIVSLPCY